MSGPPALLSRKANGVLPVAVPAPGAGSEPNRGSGAEAMGTESEATKETIKSPKGKAGIESEKVVIRRLPPGLTEDELFTILGDDWKPGNGKVGWVSFHPGKVSKDAAKPHRPACASLNLLHREDLVAFADTVRTATWADAKDTWSSPVLVGPPVAEFAIYKKVPSGRRRVDNHQGTIDQDPEFMAFLEALANPEAAAAAAAAAADGSATAGATSASKDGSGTFQPREGDHVPAIGDDDSSKSKSAVTTTPLIEFLREKKAGKNKDSKSSKRQEGGGRGKGVSGGGTDDTTSKKRTREKGDKGGQGGQGGGSDRKDRDKDRGKDKGKAGERRAKGTTVKILTKRAGSAAASPAVGTKTAAAAAAPTLAINAGAKATAAAKENMPKSRRAGIAAAAQILQRDLGLSPSVAHRRARAAVAAQEAATATEGTQMAGAAPSAPETGKKEYGSSNNNNNNNDKGPNLGTGSAPSPAPGGLKNGGGSGTREERPARGSRGKRGGADKGEKEAGKGDKGAGPVPAAAGPVPTKILLKKKDSAPAPAPGKTKGETGGAAKKEAKQPASNGESRTTAQALASATPPAVTTRAFVKHASPALGVTDALLRQALEAAGGAVTSVEMDNRKGFAFVDFADRVGLVRAMAASPIAVAQANLQVMERKDTAKKSGGNGGGNSNSRGGSGGGQKAAAASVAPSTLSDKASVTNDGSVSGDVKRPRHRGGRRRGGGGGDAGAGDAKENARGQGGGGGGRRPPAATAAAAAVTATVTATAAPGLG